MLRNLFKGGDKSHDESEGVDEAEEVGLIGSSPA